MTHNTILAWWEGKFELQRRRRLGFSENQKQKIVQGGRLRVRGGVAAAATATAGKRGPKSNEGGAAAAGGEKKRECGKEVGNKKRGRKSSLQN